ncbi:uncharacterized protein LOC129732235 [Wyeomyia smithii]|uniref:uncharacterized protein LOC129732235 n=1 Tax=Wyeomyia smithii TaxID=174621 RepID=UPI0024680FE5|nr:uncharacterized protein LOC129732235 [Wyeomyia smithii]
MDYTQLTDEEITYELALRHMVNLGPMTHRLKVQRLNNAVQDDLAKNSSRSESTHIMSPTVNFEVCQLAVATIQNEIQHAINNHDIHALTVLLSRLTHYKNRLAIVKPPGLFSEAVKSTRLLVNELHSEVNSVLTNPVSQLVSRITAEEAGAASGDATNEEHNFSGRATLPAASSPVVAGRGRGRGLPTHDVSGYRGSQGGVQSEGHVTPHQSINASSVWQPQTNGEIATREQQQRDEAAGIQRAAAGMGRRIFGQQTQTATAMGHSRCRDVRDQFDQLRNDMLRYLLRHEARPTAERGEDRRILKAIHNWPFKFRGQKDTTSLNIFLDRVEIFARSEGMSDEVLLASIKHLLQEDALDWYARAMVQGSLGSWEAFKH